MISQVEIGRNIRRYREEKGFSQAELADGLGYKDRTSIGYIESGKKPISAVQLAAVADFLDVTVSQLMERNHADSHPTSIEG